MEGLKFRAWLKKEKKLVEVLAIDFQYRQISIAPLNDKLNKFSQSGNQYCIVSPIPFDDCIIEPYLELFDENKKELCKGDIVLANPYSGYSYNGRYIINYDNTTCQFYLEHDDNDGHDFSDLYIGDGLPYRIIGNIHENPELLDK